MKIQIEIASGSGFMRGMLFFLWIENSDKEFIFKFDFWHRVRINRRYVKERAV